MAYFGLIFTGFAFHFQRARARTSILKMTAKSTFVGKLQKGFNEFLKELREENDIFAHMGAYVILKGILVENRNIWKWQKFLPYRRNFYFPISRIKFQTYFIIIIFRYMASIMEIFYGAPPFRFESNASSPFVFPSYIYPVPELEGGLFRRI